LDEPFNYIARREFHTGSNAALEPRVARYAVRRLRHGCGLRDAGTPRRSADAGLPAGEHFYLFPPALKLSARGAVLPLACETRRADLPEGCEALNPVLLAELAKTKKFEVVSVNSEMLRSRTGRSGWTGAEVLPADFFESLRRSYGCDAVLFCQLTVFHAYAPLAVGWRMKMVDTRTRQILWAADEVFDAGQPSVLSGARHYQLAEHRASEPDDWGIRNSPRQFGQYAAAQLAARLPGRQKVR
jgi:hypothetical protein